QAKISRFEDGISCPSHDELLRLAATLNQPVKMFTRKDVNRSVFNSFYRKRKAIPQRTIAQFNALVSLRQVQIDRLISKVDVHAEPIPKFDPDDYPGSYAQVSQQLRQFLRLPPGPVKKLIRPLEDV